jgi:hypothetical protein
MSGAITAAKPIKINLTMDRGRYKGCLPFTVIRRSIEILPILSAWNGNTEQNRLSARISAARAQTAPGTY